jgi:hypothetical protein
MLHVTLSYFFHSIALEKLSSLYLVSTFSGKIFQELLLYPVSRYIRLSSYEVLILSAHFPKAYCVTTHLCKFSKVVNPFGFLTRYSPLSTTSFSFLRLNFKYETFLWNVYSMNFSCVCKKKDPAAASLGSASRYVHLSYDTNHSRSRSEVYSDQFDCAIQTTIAQIYLYVWRSEKFET